MKHLCGDRSESVPRPQRAQHAHERARRRPQAAAPPPSRRRSAHGARSARFFSREAPPHSIFLRYSRQAGRSAQAARHARARGLQANHAESWPGPRIHCRRAQRPQSFEEELLKGVPATVRRSSVSMEQPRERTCSERTTASEAQVKSASSAGKRQGETVCRCGAGAGAWSSGWAGRQARTRARAAAAAAGHRVRRFGMASVSPWGRGRRRRAADAAKTRRGEESR